VWPVTPFRTRNLAVRERRRRGIHLGLIKNVLFPAVALCTVQSLQSGQELSLALRYKRGNFVFVISAPKALEVAATYFCDQLVPLLRWCSQSVLSIDHGWQLGLNTTAPSTSRQYWGHHPRFNLVCSTSTCVRPSNRSPTGRAEPEPRTVK